MPKLLSEAAVEQYRRDGFTFPARVLTAEEAAGCRRCLEDYEAKTGGPIDPAYSQKTNLLFTWADALVHHPRLLDAIEDIIGPNILLWSTELFIKEVNDPRYVTWHQDDTYWHLEPGIEVTAWLALNDVPIDRGPMRFIPGSHRGERYQIINRPEKHNMLMSGQIAQGFDESTAVDAVLKAGEISLHHTRTLHASKANASKDRRLGFVARFVPTHVRQLLGRESAMLVRGVDGYGHFDLEPRPAADLDPAALAAHRDAVERHLTFLRGDNYQANQALAKKLAADR